MLSAEAVILAARGLRVPGSDRHDMRRAIFASVPDVIASIQNRIDVRNAAPPPYVWTATAASILAEIERARIPQTANEAEMEH